MSRRAAAALRQARVAARPHLAAARAPRRRPRAAPARVRHQAGGVGQGAARPRRSRPTTRVATLGPEAWPDPPPLRELLAAQGARPLHARAARPARDRRDRALVGRRDPVDGEAVAVQARRRPRPTTRPSALRDGDASSASAARSSTTSSVVTLPIPDKLPMPLQVHRHAGRAVPALRHDDRGGPLRGLRHVLLPARPDRRARAQGPPALAAAEVTAGVAGGSGHDRTRPDRTRLRAPRPGRQRRSASSDLRGGRVVLYFYPKADTPGCTTQACGVRDHRADYEAAGAVVLGVSPDPVKAVKKFHDKQALDFTLLADEDHAVAEPYGVWVEKSMYGRTYWGAARATFVIDERGRRAPRHPEGRRRRRTTRRCSRRWAI